MSHQGFRAHWYTYADRSCRFGRYVKLYKRTRLYNVDVGDMTFIAGAKIGNSKIGKFCSIGPEALVGELGVHPTTYLSTHPAFYSTQKQCGISFVSKNYFNESPSYTEIGNDVWIGFRAIILDGIKIGDGAIVAAGAVVIKDVPSYAIVGGVPAKLIRYRFEPEVIRELVEWQWWDLPHKRLIELAPKFREEKNWTADEVNRLKKNA